MQAQYVGTNVRIENAFDNGGTPTDPATVTFNLKTPGQITAVTYTFTVDPEISKDAVGVYRFDFVPIVAGTYVYTWLGSGTVSAQSLGFFEVLPALTVDTRVPAYMTSADLDARIGAGKVDELFDDDGDNQRDSVVVNTILVEAEDFAATYMLSAWPIDADQQDGCKRRIVSVSGRLGRARAGKRASLGVLGRRWQGSLLAADAARDEVLRPDLERPARKRR
jgi:hypothetical protein